MKVLSEPLGRRDVPVLTLGSAAVPLTELQPGDPPQIGPYQLLNRLGNGGMGRVYLGRSPGGRLVAVKVISPELADSADFRTRFAREVAAAQQVSGLFTAPVVDARVDGTMPWLVTAFIRGPSLEEAIARSGPLPAVSVLDLAAGLAEGLGAIHSAGLVHRDLKPTNVILAEDGPRVIDFGISRAAGDTALTRTGLVMGSPGFMSPEQAEGRDVGLASDVFSLGGVLVFAATGRTPFGNGPTAAVVYRIVHGQPDLERIPGPLRALISRCLAKDATQRPTTGQLLAEIEQCRAGVAQLTAKLVDPDGTLILPPPPGPVKEPHGIPHTVASFHTPVAPADVTPVTTPPHAPPLPSAAILQTAARRRRAMILLSSAIVVVLGVVTGLVVWAPWDSSVPSAPTALVAAATSFNSVSFRWSPPTSGPVPDQYLIYQNGRVIGSVPAGVTNYYATGLTPDTAYRYDVVAESGGHRSGPSSVLTTHTGIPPVSAATLTGDWSGNYTITSSSGYASGLQKGNTLSGVWNFSPHCAIGPCPATLSGDLGGTPFTAHLTDAAAVYTGTTPIQYTVCDIGSKQYQNTDKLSFRITVGAGTLVGGGWTASAWSGVMTMTTPSSQCQAGLLTANFSSAKPTKEAGS
jgi:serine/threonine protein kinase